MPTTSTARHTVNNGLVDWSILDNYERIIKKYDKKKTGSLWWRKRYCNYFNDDRTKDTLVAALEKQIADYRKLSWWKKPFVFVFSRISAKEKLLNYHYARELAVKLKDYHAHSNQRTYLGVWQLLSKIESHSTLSGIGKQLARLKASFIFLVTKQQSTIQREASLNGIQVEGHVPINPPSNTPLTPDVIKNLFIEIEKILNCLDTKNILSILKLFGVVKYNEDSKFGNNEAFLNLMPLLHTNNANISQATKFYMILFILKKYIRNYDEVLANASELSPNLKISINDMDFFHSMVFMGLNSEHLFTTFLNYYPVTIKSVTLDLHQNIGPILLLRSLPKNVSDLKICFTRCSNYRNSPGSFVLESIVTNLPNNIKHLDLSNLGLFGMRDLPSIFKRLPATLSTIDLSDNNLSSCDDAFLTEMFNSLPRQLLGLKLSEKNMTLNTMQRLNRLASNIKVKITNNIRSSSLKDLVANFVWANMNPAFTDEQKSKLQLQLKGTKTTANISGDISEFIESRKHLGFSITPT